MQLLVLQFQFKHPTIDESDPTNPKNKNNIIAEFTSIFNLTGQPSITIPMGKDNNSLPMGIMISGKKFRYKYS